MIDAAFYVLGLTAAAWFTIRHHRAEVSRAYERGRAQGWLEYFDQENDRKARRAAAQVRDRDGCFSPRDS